MYMKTLINLFVIPIIFLSGNILFSQDNRNFESIWVTVNDLSILPKTDEGNLASTSIKFQEIIENFNIVKVEQVLPDSRKESLLKVYELTCECNSDLLKLEIEKSEFEINKPSIAPDYQFLTAPNDYNLTFTEDYALDIIRAEGAWGITTGDSSVTIGITDSGYDINHDELIGTVSYVQPGLAGGNYYHGTAVAITAAGNTNNQIGKSSIGYNCDLQLRSYSYNSILAACYGGARIINVSWYSSCGFSAYYQGVIDEVYENGSIVVAAAGNGSATCNGASSKVYPASLNHVISVTSVGPLNNHERIIGDQSSTHQHNDSVDIAAPGYDVALSVQNGWYLTGNGTSFAAPYVSGTIGLMLSINPCLSFDDVELILKQTAFNIDSINPNYIGGLGAGRLDAQAAVEMAASYQTDLFDLIIEVEYECFNSETGTANIIIIDNEIDPSNYSVNWNTGDSLLYLQNLETGVYTVEVVNEFGCSVESEVTIDVPHDFSLNIDVVNVKCHGGSDGMISVGIVGGNPGYSCNVAINDNYNINLLNLAAGVSVIEVEDANGCFISKEIIISEPDELTLNYIELVDTVQLIITGGSPQYNVLWDNGNTTEQLIGIENGMYVVTVTDANNCEAVSEVYFNNSSLGADSPSDKIEYSLYPNPTKNTSKLEYSKNALRSVQVINSAGQKVRTYNDFSGNFITLDLDVAGVYYIQLQFNDGTSSIDKLVVTD
jgi:hypothetical protein